MSGQAAGLMQACEPCLIDTIISTNHWDERCIAGSTEYLVGDCSCLLCIYCLKISLITWAINVFFSLSLDRRIYPVQPRPPSACEIRESSRTIKILSETEWLALHIF
jgi:hypothetical protein